MTVEWKINHTGDSDRKLTGEDLNDGDFFTLAEWPEGLFFKDISGFFCLKSGGEYDAGTGDCDMWDTEVIRVVNVTVTGHPENGAST
jgi:hypothetical protein